MRAFPRIADVAPRLRARDITAVEVVEACLARIEELQPRLNAFITVLDEQAREQARQADADIRAGRYIGPLHGIPVGVKDFYDTANVRTTAAFEPFRHRVPKRDAEAVAALKDAGAIVVGKTNMHQLGTGTTGLESAFGAVGNPVNDAYIPGGSSSGSAAAVATGMCYATLDTDAIGSCRLPAACCGVVGFKPTFGAIGLKGILEGEKADETILRFAHAGITTRSVDDTAIMFQMLTLERRGVPSAAPDTLRLGIADNFTADAEIAGAFENAVDVVRTIGYPFVRAQAPFDMPKFGDLRTIDADRAAIGQRAFRDIDVLLLPATATTVLTVESAAGKPQALSAVNTLFANYFGLPAISVPCGVDARGLPVGLQIVGRPSHEATILRVAGEFETRVARA
ncbi:MAG TPA: amidase [Vicinamibacterales bacterium]|jgi:aspartyl-tRNA(Asn)/glutamyl-tRNA(Gln) amidotransferase subunit A|nr:amidase [Vicinamibacterales bacterium]